MYIKFEEQTHKVESVEDFGYTHITLENGEQYYIFPSREEAGVAAREYWEDMAQNDTREFTYIVGEESLIAWALGDWGGPGSEKVKSLDDWLDLWLDVPEEHFASYDGTEVEVDRISPRLGEELGAYDDLGFAIEDSRLYSEPCQYVLYRHN